MPEYIVSIEVRYMNYVCCNERERGRERSPNILFALSVQIYIFLHHKKRQKCTNILSVRMFLNEFCTL